MTKFNVGDLVTSSSSAKNTIREFTGIARIIEVAEDRAIHLPDEIIMGYRLYLINPLLSNVQGHSPRTWWDDDLDHAITTNKIATLFLKK
jgi:hypothetical protein